MVNTQRELLGEAWEALEAMKIAGKVPFKENVQWMDNIFLCKCTIVTGIDLMRMQFDLLSLR